MTFRSTCNRIVAARIRAYSAVSPRNFLLMASIVFLTTCAIFSFILFQYFNVPASFALIFEPSDCFWRYYENWSGSVGRHCFGDYLQVMLLGMQPNPWLPLSIVPSKPDFVSSYTASAMIPQVIFGHLGRILGSPRIGVFAYLFFMAISVLSPARWASRSAVGVERLVIFVVCGLLATPVWILLDGGNSTGFAVPAMLAYLVALRRDRWDHAAFAAVVAALIKPHFGLLVMVFFVARKWRVGFMTTAGMVISNVVAYLVWPRDFPRTIAQSLRLILSFGRQDANSLTADNVWFVKGMLFSPLNVSFAKGLLLIPNGIEARREGGILPIGYLATLYPIIGLGIPIIFIGWLIFLGRRIPSLMAGIVLLATASLSPVIAVHYYLVFALPVAAVILRDPKGPVGSGVFDRVRSPRKAVAMWTSFATAICVALVPLPVPPVITSVSWQHGVFQPQGTEGGFVETTAAFAPVAWIVAIIAILVSYSRRAAYSPRACAERETETGDHCLPSQRRQNDCSTKSGRTCSSDV